MGPASPGGTLPANGTVILDVSDGAVVVPSFLGKSMRSVIEAAQTAGIEVDAFGSGVAREQSPAPGSRLRREEEWRYGSEGEGVSRFMVLF